MCQIINYLIYFPLECKNFCNCYFEDIWFICLIQSENNKTKEINEHDLSIKVFKIVAKAKKEEAKRLTMIAVTKEA